MALPDAGRLLFARPPMKRGEINSVTSPLETVVVIIILWSRYCTAQVQKTRDERRRSRRWIL